LRYINSILDGHDYDLPLRIEYWRRDDRFNLHSSHNNYSPGIMFVNL